MKNNPKDELVFPVRINRYMAITGLCTRRKADGFIEAGLVTINDRVAVLGDKVMEGDVVRLKQEILERSAATRKYVLYYKPVGVVTEEITPPVVSKVPLFPVGRLDKESEGLILLTTDGRVTERLLHPSYDHDKEYEVVVDKRVLPRDLRRLAKGVDIEGYTTKPAEVEQVSDTTFHITLTEGKKHQIRRMCAAVGYTVVSLKRVRILNLGLSDLKPGGYHVLSEEEAEAFLTELGLR